MRVKLTEKDIPSDIRISLDQLGKKLIFDQNGMQQIVCDVPINGEEWENRLFDGCKKAIKKAIQMRCGTILFDIESLSKSSNQSFIINTLLDLLDEKISDETDLLMDRTFFVLKRSKIKKQAFKEFLNLQNTEIVTNLAFGDYGDKTKTQFNNFVDSLPNQKLPIEYLSEKMKVRKVKKDSEIYKMAGISRSVYSSSFSYKKDSHYPSRGTLAAISIGLQLTLNETQEFYNTANLFLGYNLFLDRVIRFFIDKKIYNIDLVNDCLSYYGYPILGEKPREDRTRKFSTERDRFSIL